MAELETLVELQALDLDIDAKRHRLDEIRVSVGVTPEVKQARAALEAARVRLHDDETRQRQLEWEVDDRTSKIKELDAKLYSGTIKNPKELASLQTEIEHMRADLASVEERALDAITATDDQRAEVGRQQAALSLLEQRWRGDQAHMTSEQAELDTAAKHLEARRQAIAASVSPPTLARYEELRRTRRGLAVARIERNTCLGCRTSLATSEVQSARQGKIAFCSSCGRILYGGR